MKSISKNSHFMNGVPELLILRQLSEGEMYGYNLVRAIQSRTKSTISLSEGCVYPLLHALERKGWLSSRRATADGRVRVYYRLTAKGRQRLDKITEQWKGLAAAVHNALGAAYEQPGTI